MRIVLLNQYYAPAEAATAQLLSDLGQALARRGHEVSAICSRRSYPDPSERHAPREMLHGVSIHRTWTTGFGRESRWGRLADYLTYMVGAAGRLALHPRPDVIVSLTTPPMVALLGLLLARARGASSLFWVMDIYPDLAFELGVLERDGWTGRILERISRFTLSRSTTVVALGETMAEKLRDRGATAVTVIHNWVDEASIAPRPVESHALRSAWGWNERFVVLYSGNMGLAHEFDTLLDAAEMLRDRERIVFAFVGGGPRLREVQAAVGRRGLGNVQFLPHVPRQELGQSLTAADLHLVTLRQGVAGLLVPSKIYGILCAGRPTLYVGPGEGEIATLLRDSGCGSCVSVGDAQGLARTVLDYEGDAERRIEEGRRARRVFEERFSREQTLDRWIRLVEESPSRR